MQLLTAAQIYEADSATIRNGISGEILMENAGKVCADEIKKKFSPRSVLVLCGSGNNGGDGFVIARLLKNDGWDVTVVSIADVNNLKGDAKIAAGKWGGEILPMDINLLRYTDLVIDAIFGVGLSRKVTGEIADIIDEILKLRLDVVSVDIPSGVNSDTGEIMGTALQANLTVTFARKKIGHVLVPGRRLAGEVVVCDIGLDESVINKMDAVWENTPELWLDKFPFADADEHKYDHGHAVVAGGGIKCTGAACLASVSALRMGAGLVTVACPKSAIMVYATKLTSVMTKTIDNSADFADFLDDKRKNAVLIGPGNGVNEVTKGNVLAALKLKKSCVIDADAITVFQDNPAELFAAIKSSVVLTPHDGEFRRLFDVSGSKIERAKAAAELSGAVVILKGADTVIASPDGRLAVNTNAPPSLATAGSGDVLAGIITGLLANNMDAFLAACAGVWIHGEAANIAGIGMISEILPEFLPRVLQGINSAKAL